MIFLHRMLRQVPPSLFRRFSQQCGYTRRQSQIVCGPERVGCGKRLSRDGGLFARLHQTYDHFDPPPLQIPEHIFNDDTLCGAAGQFRIGEPHEPLARFGFDGLALKQVRNRQELA
jgi:hypothetical protein